MATEGDKADYLPWTIRRVEVKWGLRVIDVDLAFLVFRFVTHFNTRFCILDEAEVMDLIP